MTYEDTKKEKLNRLEKKLYSRNSPDIIDPGRSEMTPEGNTGPKEGWGDPKNSKFDEMASRFSKMSKNKNDFISRIFIFSAVFFGLAAAVSFFVFWKGGNMVSSRNVDIEIFGPLSIPGGQEISFDVSVKNKNNIDLDAASLLVKYPDGTRSTHDISKELNEERFNLGIIKSGESYRQNIKAIFFGEKEDVKKVEISLEYRVKNSSALFYKEKMHEISISSSPVIITAVYPKEVNSNQEMVLNIEVASNSKDKITDFLIKAEYPFGFAFKDSSPKSSFGNDTWFFESLDFGEKKNISVKGVITGQNNEERVFRISAGTASQDDERAIAVPIVDLVESVLIKKPFIDLDVLVGNQNGDYVAEGGRSVNTEVMLRNNLPSKLFNVSIRTSLKGGALNQLAVSPEYNGFFQSSDNTIFWDKRSVSQLAEIGPGELSKVSFGLTPLSYSQIKTGTKPEIEIVVETSGERILESGSVEKVFATEIRKIILGTNVSLSSRTVRSIGNLENSGPVPPKVGTPTTYTVVWSINNSLNQIGSAEVRATLPSYVKWTGIHSPSSEQVYFDEVNNEVVWNAGSVLPSSSGSYRKEVYFQLEILPSSSQLGQAPMILGEARLTGTDRVTGLKVMSRSSFSTTNFSGDPSFKVGDDKVVQ